MLHTPKYLPHWAPPGSCMNFSSDGVRQRAVPCGGLGCRTTECGGITGCSVSLASFLWTLTSISRYRMSQNLKTQVYTLALSVQSPRICGSPNPRASLSKRSQCWRAWEDILIRQVCPFPTLSCLGLTVRQVGTEVGGDPPPQMGVHAESAQEGVPGDHPGSSVKGTV